MCLSTKKMVIRHRRSYRVFLILKEIFTVCSFLYLLVLVLSSICQKLHGFGDSGTENVTSECVEKSRENEATDNYKHKTHTTRLEELFRDTVKEYLMSYRQHYKPILKNTKKSLVEKSRYKIHPGISPPKCNNNNINANSLLILIHSAPANIKRRLSIRYSWGMPGNTRSLYKTRSNNNNNVGTAESLSFRYLFVVGKAREPRIASMILKEMEEFDDILYLDFQDNYRNLTLKTLLSLSWVSENCRSDFILKTDDDCYVNVDNVLEFLAKHQNNKFLSKNLYTGRVQWTMPAIRDTSSKFYVPNDVYDKLLLPPYVSGGGYFFSGRLIEALLEANSRVKPIPNEDAHIGLLMKNIGVKPVDNWRILPFIYCNESVWVRPTCDFVDPFVIHGVENYGQLWVHYHVTVLKGIPGVCKQSRRTRKNAKPLLYCPVNLEM